MVRVLIADDHLDQRELLKFLLNKHEGTWDIFEANNGKEALAIFSREQIDIIITDVKMPIVDGIGLAEALRNERQQVPILFISGYEDFQYIKRALDLQVVNYLLKPIEPADFYTQLDNLLVRLHQSQAEATKRDRIQLQAILIKIFQGLPLTDLPQEEQSTIMPLLDQTNFLMTVDIQPAESAAVANDFNHHFHETPVFVRTSLTRFVYLLNGPTRTDALLVLLQAKEKIKNSLNIEPVLELSHKIQQSSEIFQTYQQLIRQINQHFYQQPSAGERAIPLPTNNSTDEEVFFYEIRTALQQQNFSQLKELITTTLDNYAKNASETPSITKFFFGKLYQTILENLKMNDQQHRKELKKMLESENFSKISEILTLLLIEIQPRFEHLNKTGNEYIRETKNYIWNHYAEDLNLEILAKNVNLAPKYLSDLFKREEHIGLIKYLNEVRLERAQELLASTHQRVQDIGKSVGYNSYSYFIKSFQRKTGLTPERYRKSDHGKDTL